MKAYWDSSALVEAVQPIRGATLRQRLADERGFSRRHALAEMFSALTGKAHLRVEANEAVLMLKDVANDLDWVELSTDEILQAAADAQGLGVRGGGIHDLLHARAALKSGAKDILTLDRNDFANLVSGMSIDQV